MRYSIRFQSKEPLDERARGLCEAYGDTARRLHWLVFWGKGPVIGLALGQVIVVSIQGVNTATAVLVSLCGALVGLMIFLFVWLIALERRLAKLGVKIVRPSGSS